MSTSSRRTVKRRAFSLARSSTSPTSRSSLAVSASITSSEEARDSGSAAIPSRSASTWPRIAVSGVRSSCETVMQEVALELVGLLEPRGHRAEALGQVGDLVAAAHGGMSTS